MHAHEMIEELRAKLKGLEEKLEQLLHENKAPVEHVEAPEAAPQESA